MIHIVLVEPEIHLNTGNIIRTCLATNSKLHLIKPLGFKVDESTLKRYSANNFKKLNPTIWANWNEFIKNKPRGEMFFTSRKAKKIYTSFNLSSENKNIFLVFGKESTGLDDAILKNFKNVMRLPMSKQVRSLNLSNTVMTVIYESKRQDNFLGLEIKDPFND